VAKVENRIVWEKEWMDKEPSWRENSSEVSAGSYHKKWKIAQGYLKECEVCRLEEYHVYYRYYQYV